MSEIKQFQIKATDWRGALKQNRNRTIFVVVLFVLIYLAIGFLIDVFLDANEKIPLNTTATDLITLKVIPLVTIIMLVVAGISLLITYFFHNSLMMLGTEYHEVDKDTKNLEEKKLYNVIEELKIAAGIRFMPKVYIIEADYMNAFASGFSEKSAMVAITRGLLQKLDRSELQAVMAHELSHIRHNDIRLTVTVAILCNLALIAIDLLFRGAFFSRNRKDDKLFVLIIILRIVLPILTILLMMYLSRTREYMADAGSVELTRDNEPLARALLKIDEDTKSNEEHYEKEYSQTAHEDVRQAAYLYDPKYAGISSGFSLNALFSTHPPLDKRLEALGITKKQRLEL